MNRPFVPRDERTVVLDPAALAILAEMVARALARGGDYYLTVHPHDPNCNFTLVNQADLDALCRPAENLLSEERS